MVQTGEISFAGKVAYNIKMDEAKQRIMDELEEKFRFKVIQKHHERYSDAVVVKLNNNPHLASVRTNGNPYLLYLTKFNFVNQCVFIDKKVQQGYFLPRIILTRFRFDDALFSGTLMDGEMVKDRNGNWIFVLSDLLAYRGAYLDSSNAIKRLNNLYHLLEFEFEPDELDVCHLQVKKQFAYEQIESMVTDFIPSLPYTCRGIYFKPLFLKFRDVLLNFDDNLIQKVMRQKYKGAGNFLMLEDKEKMINGTDTKAVPCSIIPKVPSNPNLGTCARFYVRKTSNPDVYELHDKDHKPHGNACVPTMKTSKMLRTVFANKNLIDSVLMRCEYSEKFEKYIPVSEVQLTS
jgi:mRNA capping enzyme, catalytic domain